jgi:hypothetical protein
MATPLSASTLVSVLRAEGVIVSTPHSGWEDHERDDETGKAFGPVHGVVIHHTAGHNVGSYVYNGSSALPGPLCHGYIRKDGVVEMCSAGRANHAGGGDPRVLTEVINESYGDKPTATQYHEGSAGAADGNDPFYGYECENLGDGKDPWPAVQYIAIVKATVAILRHYGWSEKSAIGHLEWSNWKSDPTFSMVKFRSDVKAALALPAGKWQASTSTTPSTGTTTPSTGGSSAVTLTETDLHDIWYKDIIPAQEPPYNNTDYFAADGKTVANPTWTVKYTLYTIVRSGRELLSRVKGLEASVAKVSSPTIDLDALATKIVAQLGDDLADKVADKLSQRLQG